ESNARLGVAKRAGDNAVPDVRRINESRRRRLFNQSIGEVRRFETLLVAERDGRTIGPAIDDVTSSGNRIKNRIVPGLAFEVELVPLVAINRFEKLVRNVYRDVEVS